MLNPERNRVLVDGLMNSDPFARREMIMESFVSSPPPADVRAVVLVAGDINFLHERAKIIRWAR